MNIKTGQASERAQYVASLVDTPVELKPMAVVYRKAVNPENEELCYWQPRRRALLFITKTRRFGRWESGLPREIHLGELVTKLGLTPENIADAVKSFIGAEYSMPKGWNRFVGGKEPRNDETEE